MSDAVIQLNRRNNSIVVKSIKRSIQFSRLTNTLELTHVGRQGVAGIQGPVGPPGPTGPSGTGQQWITTVQPLETPNDLTTIFTAPSPYILGTLTVILNGLREHDIVELTDQTFAFSSPPMIGDSVYLEYRSS